MDHNILDVAGPTALVDEFWFNQKGPSTDDPSGPLVHNHSKLEKLWHSVEHGQPLYCRSNYTAD